MYPVINSVLSVAAVIPGMLLVDTLGRRGVLLISCTAQGVFMFILAGVGSSNPTNTNVRGLVVASFMLFAMSYNVSLPFFGM